MSERVTLRDGPTVDIDSIRLAVDLEARGCTFMVNGDRLIVQSAHLTEAEADEIRARKADLMQIVAYTAPEVP